jgi:hypothetical protein
MPIKSTETGQEAPACGGWDGESPENTELAQRLGSAASADLLTRADVFRNIVQVNPSLLAAIRLRHIRTNMLSEGARS